MYGVVNENHKKPSENCRLRDINALPPHAHARPKFFLFLKLEKTPYRAVWDFEIWFLKIQNPFWDLK